MDKIGKIKKELERLKEETSIGLSEYENGVEQGRMEIINALSVLLESMQEESVSEELKEFEREYIEREKDNIVCVYDRHAGLVDGAKWQKEQMMKGAKSGIGNYDNYIKFEDGTWIDLDPSEQLKPAFNVNEGDKVKVIVIKEEKL